MNYFLLPPAWIFDGVTSVRNFMYDHGIFNSESYDLPVICIGNLTVGGTGKTPHTEYLIRLLQSEGYKVAVLSRGYKRKTKGYILSTEDSTVIEIGDEPYQMKKKFHDIAVAVDADRREGIANLIAGSNSKDIDVILLDDAFQHRKVKAGLNILLMDSSLPIYNDYLLPAGHLRENERGKKRADIIIVTKLNDEIGEGSACRYFDKLNIQNNQDLYFTRFIYGDLYNIKRKIPLADLEKYNVLLITGIANPTTLEQELVKYTGYDAIHFGDHHDFTEHDYKQIETAFNALPTDKPRIIITTEKDMTRINCESLSAYDSIYTLPVEVRVLRNEQSIFNEQILNYVRKNSRNSSIPKRENDWQT